MTSIIEEDIINVNVNTDIDMVAVITDDIAAAIEAGTTHYITFDADGESKADISASSDSIDDIEVGGHNEDASISTIESFASLEADSGTSNYNALYNKPRINSITLRGDKTSDDLLLQDKLVSGINIKTISGQSILGSGNIDATGDKTYFHNQTIASDTWVINHNLNKYPSITVIDSTGAEVIGNIIYNDLNTVTITFKGGFKGSASLN